MSSIPWYPAIPWHRRCLGLCSIASCAWLTWHWNIRELFIENPWKPMKNPMCLPLFTGISFEDELWLFCWGWKEKSMCWLSDTRQTYVEMFFFRNHDSKPAAVCLSCCLYHTNQPTCGDKDLYAHCIIPLVHSIDLFCLLGVHPTCSVYLGCIPSIASRLSPVITSYHPQTTGVYPFISFIGVDYISYYNIL